MKKIKAIDPKIIVNKNPDKPCYSVEYYDTADSQWHIGFSSFDLQNVIEWLNTYFDIIDTDVAPVKHGKWVYDHWCKFKCSECGEYSNSKPYKGKEKYCPNCGAKMDGDKI